MTTTAFNFFCRDVERLHAFYAALLGWDDDRAARSPIFRALRHGAVQLGFNAPAAYELLGLADRRPAVGGAVPPVTSYPTFERPTPDAVDAAVACVAGLGGRVVKPGFATYYGQWQAVLADPESNVFRLAAMSLPAGVSPAPKPFRSG